jgi:hypothetical protein
VPVGSVAVELTDYCDDAAFHSNSDTAGSFSPTPGFAQEKPTDLQHISPGFSDEYRPDCGFSIDDSIPKFFPG